VTGSTLVAAPSSLEWLREEGTLDELMVALWEGLSIQRSVACPICGSDMKPEHRGHARAIGGSCSTCGSTLR
jgi:hypothetical protein